MNEQDVGSSLSSLYQACCHETAPFRADGIGRDSFFQELTERADHAHRAKPPGSPQLLLRFQQNYRRISQVCRRLSTVTSAGRYLPPASEWLLDNKYVLDAVAGEIRTDLPKSFYRELPALQQGPLKAYPRVYELALLLLAYSDSTLTESVLAEAVEHYQQTLPLTIGELWALPIMLRLVLLDNLRRLADGIMAQVDDHQAAVEVMESALAGVLPTLRNKPSDAYALALAEELRENDLRAGHINDLLANWAQIHLADLSQIQHREFCREAADQVSIGNAVTSLRLLDVINWIDFFESTSVVEKVLREDAIYPQQDFATRNRCRDTIERLARGSRLGEAEIAQAARTRAQQKRDDPVFGQVSYYLIGEGLFAFEQEVGYRATWKYALRRLLLRHPNGSYFGLLCFFIVIGMVLLAVGAQRSMIGFTVVLLLASVLPVSEIAVALLNYLLSQFIPPRILPRFEFKEGVPGEYATFLVIPTLAGKAHPPEELIERLEQHYLVNVRLPMWFALLTDFADAPTQHNDSDEKDLQALLSGIERLNRQYASEAKPRFFLFHRKRIFNPSQSCWMGWERKRGKLVEFNRLIRGAADTSFDVISPAPTEGADAPHSDFFSRIRFVLTLDADTVLQRDTARQMIATLAHPLNRPLVSADGRSVTSGYSVLQPRVSFLYRMGLRSYFARLFTRSQGIDPYATAVSDTYMDLFGRGTFTGKGLYDVDGFSPLAETFPDNHILSHDLIESNYARCALVSDVEVFDEFPFRYHTYAKRQHRWIRGDWQLLPWLTSRVPVPRSRSQRTRDREQHAKLSVATQVAYKNNILPLLERWKIIDNLRRSLVPVGIFVVLVLSWLFLEQPWGWTIFALLALLIPCLFYLCDKLISTLKRRSFRGIIANRFEFWCTAGQALLQIAFLIDQAHIALDAIGRTLYRLFWSRQLLLEWETAAATEKNFQAALRQSFRAMLSSVVIVLVLAILLFWLQPSKLWLAGPFLLLWLSSPFLAFLVSLPRTFKEKPLKANEEETFRLVARKTWFFFESFVDEKNHWLPPDNYQEEPLGTVAQRTSPTNIGVYLLSTLAARDFGYITTSQLTQRLTKAFDTLDHLSRHQGHFFNWYDTATLTPLHPAYVSTVDSGNLMGCLLALKNGLLEYAHCCCHSPSPSLPIELEKVQQDGLASTIITGKSARVMCPCSGSFFSGLKDTASVLRHELLSSQETKRTLLDLNKSLHAAEGFLAALPEHDVAKLKRLATSISEQIALMHSEQVGDLQKWPKQLLLMLEAQVDEGNQLREEQAKKIQELAQRAERLASEMNFQFLYNPQRELFAVGFNADVGKLDSVHYDLLASEACLISYLAIARGEVPRKHWFQLGRTVTRVSGEVGILSWGGTMFEYLMPRLLLSLTPGVLLDQAQHAAVHRQIDYGRETGLPWGISESAYYAFDAAQFYQYQSFGVPALGFKRGLARDRVIAPYATLLAVDLSPEQALLNLQRIRSEGGWGPYGFYEAIDYTQDRLPEGKKSCVIRSYMAHHQGMGLLALANCLHGKKMPKRLHAEPFVRSAELLLEERVPQQVPTLEPDQQARIPEEREAGRILQAPSRRRIATADTPVPRTHLLSNGRYTMMVTNVGTGFSRWQRVGSNAAMVDVLRWRSDPTADNLGQFFYLRDRRLGTLWSAAHAPLGKHADEYEVIFALDKADFRRVDQEIETLTEVTIVPDADVEIRRITLTNLGKVTRYLDVTSYGEVVLTDHKTDLAHPAFGKLFLETEWLPGSRALLCHRRRRASDELDLWAFHVLADDLTESSTWGSTGVSSEKGISYETSRGLFLGRRGDVLHSAALKADCHALSGTVGAVLDPVFAIRRNVRIRAGEQVVLAFTTGIAESRGAAAALADRYHSLFAVHRGFELAYAHSRIELQHANLRPEEVHLFQRLAGHLFYSTGPLRAPAETLAGNQLGQSGLWRYGISGDLPIALLRLNGPEGLWHLRQLLRAYHYWRSKNLQVDFVILCEGGGGYFDQAYTEALNDVRGAGLGDWIDKPGGIFVRKGSQMPTADRTLLLSAARLIIDDRSGTLASQSSTVFKKPSKPRQKIRSQKPGARSKKQEARSNNEESYSSSSLLLSSGSSSSGYGGFSKNGKQYVIEPNNADRTPPAPWSNVIANPSAGFLITDSGSGFTWVGNSQLNRLTPWSNDPVSDPPGEVIYLQDQSNNLLWCPTPLPIRDETTVRITHGQGCTSFNRVINGIDHDLTVGVPHTDPLKLSILRIKNTTTQKRDLSITYYLEWVLGTNRTATSQHIVTSIDSVTNKALFAQNAFNPDFPRAVAFAAMNLDNLTFSGNRGDVIGRNRSLAAPICFEYQGLSGQVGAGLDPCAALQGMITLHPGEEREIVFLLGQAENKDAAQQFIKRYLNADTARSELSKMVDQWEQVASALQVETPDPAFNIMMNRWLIYQTLSCRFWGRSAFYQSGGAYGFRDQLQDVMALVYSRPDLARTHILRAASRQFEEGDVQHWWHVPSGNGVRTKFSDDFLWLPFVVCHYVSITGDQAILTELVPYLRAELLPPDKHEVYGPAAVSETHGTLYDHCVRALHLGWKIGPHGLPLMGCGDWNDGMNRVGLGGKGESVWVAWFQMVCLAEFAPLALKRGDAAFAEECHTRIKQLRDAIDQHAWDGRWYRRAYFDDGTPLGSITNQECQIDSLVQSWAVIANDTIRKHGDKVTLGKSDKETRAQGDKENLSSSGSWPVASDHPKLHQAMDEVLNRLLHFDQHLMLLFDPPFDTAPLDPGYIKGYLPGIRENGGQYTHAACWVVQALTMLGRANDAYRIYEMLNPIHMTQTEADVHRYRDEPYVLTGDVYHHPQLIGRGGWSWYTGSAAWYYRVGLENILGFNLRHDRLFLQPIIPPHWPEFSIRFRYGRNTNYSIKVQRQSETKQGLTVDGAPVSEPFIQLVDDGKMHSVTLAIAR